MVEIPLREMSRADWWQKYEKVISDPFIRTKYDRIKRLREKLSYIKSLAPEILSEKGYVLDIGPGPGEFLEICRAYGNEVIGIDAVVGDCEMGEAYLQLSRLLTERQDIPVLYKGFENLLKNGLPLDDGVLSFVNSQGSIEQVFKKHLTSEDGLTCKDHRICSRLSWVHSEEMKNDFILFFEELRRILCPYGTILIFANGAKNTEVYDETVRTACVKTGFVRCSTSEEYQVYKGRIHKFRKL